MEENVQGSRQKYLKYKQKYIYKKNLVGGAPETPILDINSFFGNYTIYLK